MWISVNDHLPDDEEDYKWANRYLVTVHAGDYRLVEAAGYSEDEQKFYNPDGWSIKPTHWMHMPEPAE